MQVYLPDELYAQVKEQGLPASELLQAAVRAELRHRELLRATDRYLDELEAEVGPPSPAQQRKAEQVARRLAARRSAAQAG